MSLAVGIDLGGSTVRAALVEADGTIRGAARHVLTARSPAAVVQQIVAAVRSLDPRATALPAAAGVAAQLLSRSGVVAVAPNLGWFDVPLGRLLAEAFGHDVRLVNDLDAITFGEASCGAGRGAQDVACVFIGTGVGLGVLSQGVLLEGADGLATELGHIKIASPADGRLCGCGERGCLEAYTSGRHLPELLAEKAAAGIPSPLLASMPREPVEINAARIEAAAVSGDPAACALWAEVGDTLGVAVANVATLLNPRVLILGGGVLTLARSLKERLVQGIKARTARPALVRLEIRDTELGDQAGLVGAGLLAHRRVATKAQV